MSATAQPLRAGKRPPSRTPEREALAAAIERHRVATTELARLERARERAEGMVDAAWERKYAAEQAVKEAGAGENAHKVAVLLGEADEADSPVRVATAALEEAQAAYEAARSARAAVNEPLSAIKNRIQITEMVVRDAVAAVVRSDPSVGALVDEHRAQLKRLVGLRRALSFLDGRGCIADKHWAAEAQWPELSGAESWRQALVALQTDPDAPLP